MTTTRALSGLALAALLQPAAHASYTAIYSLGDSLSDAGNFLPYVTSLDPTYQGQANFIENGGQVWTQSLANHLGLSSIASNLGGTNYAYGGARIDGEGYRFSQAASLLDQTSTLLADNNGVLDSEALYTVWIGGNDIFWILQEGYSGSEITSYMADMTTNTIAALSQLKSSGAQYIVMPTIADVSLTPFGSALSDDQRAQLSTLISTYNTQLMSAVNQSGIEIIPLPINLMLGQILSNPTRYGYTNTTEPLCGSTDIFYCFEGITFTEEQASQYVFSDSVHPTSSVQSLTGDYVYNLLNSAAFFHMRQTQLTLNTAQQRDRLSNWIVGTKGQQSSLLDVQANAGQSDKNLDSPSGLSISLSQPINETTRAGVSLYAQRSDLDNDLGHQRIDAVGLQLWGAFEYEQASVIALAGMDSSQINLKRNASLGAVNLNHKSDSDALTLSTSVLGTYTFEQDKIKHGPFAGLSGYYFMIDGFTEKYSSDNYASAMKVGDVNGSVVETQLGWEISYDNSVAPYAKVSWHHSVHSDFDDATLSLVALPDNQFSLPESPSDSTYGQWQTGIRWSINDTLQLNADVQSYFALQQSSNTHGSVGLTYAF
jgi:outer membrane lipase/esterase